MRVLLVVEVDATIKIYFKRAPFYNALVRGSLVNENRSLLIRLPNEREL